MSDIKIGDYVYRRTINNHVLTRWQVVAERGWWIFKEYYLIEPTKLSDDGHYIVIEKARDLFKVPELSTFSKKEGEE